MARLGLLVATCGYVGYAPIAPGTFGSAAGLAILYLLRASGSSAVEAAVIPILFFLGVWAAGVVETTLKTTDPGIVVIDEVVGMMMTLVLLPVNWLGALVGFVIFRALDVVKPWPAGRFEALHGGLGIMADDVMAGIYGYLLMRGLMFLWPAWLAV